MDKVPGGAFVAPFVRATAILQKGLDAFRAATGQRISVTTHPQVMPEFRLTTRRLSDHYVIIDDDDGQVHITICGPAAACGIAQDIAEALTRDRPKATTRAEVTPFAEAYPTPWRISGCGQEIQDRDGNHVNAADLDDPDEREFWTGIIAAVNFRQRATKALKAALGPLDAARRGPIGGMAASTAWMLAYDALREADGRADG